jgi:predicted dehydrogenase
MTDTRKITKAVVVGLGSIALRHRRNLKLLFPEVLIIAVPASGRVSNQNVEFADKIILTLEEAIKEKIDIAIVASPASFHAIHVKPLLLAGIPSLVEKPVTSNLQDAQGLIRIHKETDTPTAIGYCLRYMPSSIKMKELLGQNIIGNIYNAFVSVGQYLPDWRPSKDYKNSVSAKKSLGGGALLELSHEIDYIQWLLGSMKVHYAQLRSSSELNLEVEELVDVILVSDTGTVCNIHLDFLQKKASRTCSFIGEKGRLDWDLLSNTIVLHTGEGGEVLFSEADWDSNQMYLSLLTDFLDLAAGRKNSSIDLEQATKTVELIESIKNCAIEGVKQ